jgi:hypothetical protein
MLKVHSYCKFEEIENLKNITYLEKDLGWYTYIVWFCQK